MKSNKKLRANYIFFYIMSGIIALSVIYGAYQIKSDNKQNHAHTSNSAVYKIVDNYDTFKNITMPNLQNAILNDDNKENNYNLNETNFENLNETQIIEKTELQDVLKSSNFVASKTAVAETKKDVRAEIDIIYNGRTFKYKDSLMTAPDHTVAETISKRKINEPLADKMRMVDKCINAGSSIKAGLLYSFPLLVKTVETVRKEVDCEALDSQITFEPERKPMFYITKEKTGFQLIESRLYHDIYLSFKRSEKSKVVAVPKVLRPNITTKDNIELTNLRSKFKTDYSISIEERKHNVRLALSSISGTVLMPNSEFSFNKTVGRRSQKRGYKLAKIIVKGEYVEGVGGGVCQASTTVYNAAIRAGLEVTQVRNHSLTPSYIAPSFDAMVTASSSDLKFVNTGERPVFIRSYGTDNAAYAEIYGAKLSYNISAESQIVSKGEPPKDKEIIDYAYKHVSVDALAGEKVRVSYGHGSLSSKGFLIYKDEYGKIIEKKLIRTDNYVSSKGVIAIAPPPKTAKIS